jgi:hypothetical protein
MAATTKATTSVGVTTAIDAASTAAASNPSRVARPVPQVVGIDQHLPYQPRLSLLHCRFVPGRKEQVGLVGGKTIPVPPKEDFSGT